MSLDKDRAKAFGDRFSVFSVFSSSVFSFVQCVGWVS
jgi:hypothetical protein